MNKIILCIALALLLMPQASFARDINFEENNDDEIVKRLKQQPDPLTVIQKGQEVSSVCLAFKYKKSHVIDYLLTQHFNVNMKCPSKKGEISLLEQAMEQSDLNMEVKAYELFKRGANVDSEGYSFKADTIFQNASYLINKIKKFSLDNYITFHGLQLNPLRAAMYGGDKPEFSNLLKMGADLKKEYPNDTKNGYSLKRVLFFLSIIGNNIDIAKQVLALGYTYDASDIKFINDRLFEFFMINEAETHLQATYRKINRSMLDFLNKKGYKFAFPEEMIDEEDHYDLRDPNRLYRGVG